MRPNHPKFSPDSDSNFALFWSAFPRRVSKQAAIKAWAQLKPTPELVDTILAALAWQVRQPSWTKDGGAFVPYPASWLNGRRWEDEPFHAPPEVRPMVGRRAVVPDHEPL